MKSLKLLSFLLCCWQLPLLAAEPFYPASAIPEGLKKNAHSIMRLNETTFRVIDGKEIRAVQHQVITILDREADQRSSLMEPYDKQMEIRSISGAYYDDKGNQVKKLRQSDIRDVAAGGDAQLISDGRYKLHEFTGFGYPYTIEYTVEYKLNSAYFLRTFQPQELGTEAVEKAVLNVTMPADLQLRFKMLQTPVQPVIADAKEGKNYTWTFSNIPAIKKEALAVPMLNRVPFVLLAASEFDYGAFHGKSGSWQELGNFFYRLNAGRDGLPDNMKTKVHQLTDNLSTEQEKISALYSYLQSNFRYISIQLGIGGFQTIDAQTTAKTGYGDCKGLSNMMCAMLREAGIPANMVLVQGGDEPRMFPEDFAADWFNHVIACVPGKKDTTWLECTSAYLPAGYLSGFTGNRAVVVLDSLHSKLTHTPHYGQKHNHKSSLVNAVVDENGNMKIKAEIRSTGMMQDELSAMINNISKQKQLEILRNGLDFSNYDVTAYETSEDKKLLPTLTEKLEITATNYATVTGKRMFLLPNVMSRYGIKLEEDSARFSPIAFPLAYSKTDTVNITIPAGYKVETQPRPQVLTSKYGSLSTTLAVNGNTIMYIRKLDINGGTYAVAEYNEIMNFANTIYKADRNRLVLVKEQ
ncbi:MAG: DUF3857 domain-containing protein [Chitinophaga sp.]|uniref:DUF3857 domain-containing protein n=1 Tax=Chitinophaga sp. TaxID=1869181 RepID=UPI0025C05A07|nr:DUF3857 domain-containing protein [Chitinophaga sp.]MBV8251718.1 DUF3857 domain-containing protein [Chitinophaga sp.]